jgi:nitrogen fixation protein FixH
MNKILKLHAGLVLILASSMQAGAQNINSAQVTKKNGYTLTFDNNDPALDPGLKKKLTETFFEVYPKLAKEYNKNTSKNIRFMVDTTYKGVAATDNDQVTFSASYMAKHPADIDVVTHEVMHIVQSYGNSVGPGWLTEGIADYARYQFGVDNAAAHWQLPEVKAGQNYENSYRITARFLAWIEKKVKPGTIKAIDASLRAHSYSPEIWLKLTHKDLDTLWSDYVKNSLI